jgi:hypothetical protein
VSSQTDFGEGHDDFEAWYVVEKMNKGKPSDKGPKGRMALGILD